MKSEPLLRCTDLVVGHQGRPQLPPVQLEIGAGQFWLVVGRNGSGKTTFFRTVVGLLPPVSGRVSWPGGPVPLAWLAQRLSFDDLIPVLVEDVVSMGAMRGWSFWSGQGQGSAAVRAALEAAGASHLIGRTFRSLSEGQKQRVLLARMVASGARLALLDEPTAALDAVATEEAMAVLDDLRRRYGLTVVVVSHHLSVAVRFADHILYVDDQSQTVASGPTARLLEHPDLRRRYGGVTI
jgi:zinc transport system ATP-binding protein